MGKRGPAGAAAPKQKAAKAAAKAAAAAVPAAGSPEALALALPLQQPSSVNTQALTLNGKIWATHLENVRVFKEQAVSEDLVQMKPLDRRRREGCLGKPQARWEVHVLDQPLVA